jgi:hypothetical protein
MKFLFLILLICSFSYGQIVLKGEVTDVLKKPIPYCSIGVLGKSIGTLTNEDGKFELKIKQNNFNDSIKVFCLGYVERVYLLKDFISPNAIKIELEEDVHQLEEIEVKSKKIAYQSLGTKKFTTNNCSGFVKNEENWKGSETAINANNTIKTNVLLEEFSMYVIQNKYTDSLKFRLMFYEASEKNYPRYKAINRKAIVFKIPPLFKGEFKFELKKFNINTEKNFFISLECLESEMDISKFCYAGSPSVPSFVKAAPFARWQRIRGGGADFKIKISYNKN